MFMFAQPDTNMNHQATARSSYPVASPIGTGPNRVERKNVLSVVDYHLLSRGSIVVAVVGGGVPIYRLTIIYGLKWFQ